MKTLAFGVLAIAVTALVAVQHQQLGQLRAENATLQQTTAEAGQLKADLAKSTGAEANAEDEIARLREENRDLLKLRNQVYQLRQATARFEQVSAVNQQLQSLVREAAKPVKTDELPQPIIILIQNLSNHGLSTPEDAVQTFFWAELGRDADALSNCIVPERLAQLREQFNRGYFRNNFDGIESIEIVARRDLDTNTVQIGIQAIRANNTGSGGKLIVTLRLRDGEWKVDVNGLGL